MYQGWSAPLHGAFSPILSGFRAMRGGAARSNLQRFAQFNPTELRRRDTARHMQPPHRTLSTSRQRQRLALWALAVLQWIAAVLFAGTQITPRHLTQRGPRISLEYLTRMVIKLIVIRAGELARRRRGRLRFWKHGRDLRRAHLIRSLLGSRLRRALKHKDLATRLARLIAVLRQLDAYAQVLARRFKHRLTRLWPIAPSPTPTEPIRAAPMLQPALADSS
jgi:hypothetical protein